MKITQELRSQLDASTKNTHTPTDKQAFQQIVQSSASKLQQQELAKLMDTISQQGDRLVRFRTFRELVKFKRLIKRFLREAVANGLDIQKSNVFSMTGQSRSLTTIREIDEKLIELTDAVLNQEKKTVDLLGMIGEIKGLLVNLYM